MKKPIWATVLTVVMTATVGIIPAQAAAPSSTPGAAETAGPVDPPLYDETAGGGTVRVNVVTKNRADLPGAATAGTTMQSFETVPVVTLKVNRGGLDKLAGQPGVVSVTEDVPVPPTLESTRALADVPAGTEEAGRGSAIAILDTGVDTGHPYVKDRIVSEACFSPTDPDPDYAATSLCPDGTAAQTGPGAANSGAGPCAAIAECDHGTHVAGIAAGSGKNLAGAPASGVAPAANLIAIQIFSKFSSEDVCGGPEATPCVLSFTSAQIAGLERVQQLKQSGIPVIAANLSLGSGRYTTACEDDPRKQAITNLFNAGVATVVAAGNNGADAVSAPACVSSAIAVGSTTVDDQLSSFTNRGQLLDLFARGTGVVSSVPGGGYGSKNGTSMAAPYVAGALAVLREAFPEKNLAALESLLKSTGKPITYTGATTPRVDLAKALGQGPGDIVDFNCDGRRDIAIADPDATVSGAAKAGRVQLVYGGGKGNGELSQALSILPGSAAEANDRFGGSLATFDHNLDGCTDLAVGVPGEAIGTQAGAGGVHIVYGSTAGLGQGKATVNLVQGSGIGALAGMSAEAGDRMGEALAAGTTIAGVPYLALGVPGEDGGGFVNPGAVVYLHGTGLNNVLINQNSEGVPGTMESNDDFGASLAGSPQHLAIGSPGEAIGSLADAGAVAVFNHKLNSAKIPTSIAGLDQNLAELQDGAEAGDTFGFSLSMTTYRPNAAATGTESLLVIGTPGEGTTTVNNTGRIDVIRLTPTGFSQLSGIHQGSTDVSGANEDGDRFGHTVAAVSTNPSAVSTALNTVVAVGVPGEDLGTATDVGGIMVFGLLGKPGDSDVTVHPGRGLPGAPVTGEKVGNALTATGAFLYVGVPDGPTPYGRAHTVPWFNIIAGGSEPVTTYEPGKNGLPATGQRFGAGMR